MYRCYGVRREQADCACADFPRLLVAMGGIAEREAKLVCKRTILLQSEAERSSRLESGSSIKRMRGSKARARASGDALLLAA